jgi:2-polyprenyl-6-methoxyphenol hydroxylase-like FAD-dependent oxidoreductase
MRITVAGAGLSGALLAQGLRDHDVVVYERDEATGGQGYRLHIAPEGDLAMRECLPPDLYAEVLATAGKRGSGWRVLDPQLRVVRETLVPHDPEAEEATGRHLTVDRTTLRRILLTGVDVRYGTAVERFEVHDGGVRAYLSSGEVADGDLLVAADGTHSRVRAQLLPHAEVEETGIAEIFGRTPLTARVRELTPEAALDGFCAIAGADGRFVPLAAHRFPDGRGDYVMWVVGAPAPMFPADLSGVDKRESAADLVKDWHPHLGELIRLGDPASVHCTTMRIAKPLEPWESGPVTLMGDAIHTMIPQGQSAAIALRDAAVLSRRLHEQPLAVAVRDYEREMLEYAFAAVEQSRRGLR